MFTNSVRAGFQLAQIGPNKILARIRAREFFPQIGLRRSVRIAISADILHPGGNDIPYAAHAALEIDHARTVGGSQAAPLRALALAPDRSERSSHWALQRLRGHRMGSRVEHCRTRDSLSEYSVRPHLEKKPEVATGYRRCTARAAEVGNIGCRRGRVRTKDLVIEVRQIGLNAAV